ncbi:MAG: type II and III secretion system protein family protein [Hyphomicrobiaceae bacterium]|nr:type II and III secretion system protein family protein [Hyphomicrobiaceae bacterium]
MKMIRKTIGSTVGLLATMLILSIAVSGAVAHATETITDEMAANGVLEISSGDMGKTKNVRIFPGKALVLELPTEVRDVLIANPGTMDAVIHTSTRVYLIAKKLGQTNAIFFAADGSRILTLNVEIGGGRFFDLERIFARIMPGSKVNIEAIGNTVLLTGSVKTPVESSRASSIAKSYFTEFRASRRTANSGGKGSVRNKSATTVVNMLTVDTKEQVMLKVRIVEMNREVVKQLGVNFSAALNTGNMAFSMVSNNPFSALGTDLIPGNGIGLASATRNFSINKILKIMERNGMTRTLSEPNVTAISGETAKFHVGGEVPIPVASNNNTISVEWKKFGVMLNFTPIVLSEGRISLQIKSEVSEISQEGAISIGGITLPSFSTRNAESTLELPSGGSMMMAGMISTKTRQAVNGLPGLKNLPVLGTLFRSRDYVKQETELVVIVTPYIVNPVATRKLSTPDAGFAEASDAKANLLGHLNRVYGRKPRLPRGRQHGNYGFIVE